MILSRYWVYNTFIYTLRITNDPFNISMLARRHSDFTPLCLTTASHDYKSSIYFLDI